MDTRKYLVVVEVHTILGSDSKLAQYMHRTCAKVEALADINLLICSYGGIMHWLPDEESNVPGIIYFVLMLRLRHHNQTRLGRWRFCCTVAPFYDKQGGGHDFTE